MTPLEQIDIEQAKISDSSESEKDCIQASIQDYESSSNRSLQQRLFSKLRPGSMRGSIISLSMLSIGIGCMYLPQVFARLSVIQAFLFIIISASFSYSGLVIIINAGRKKGITIYTELIKEIFGLKSARFFDITIIVYLAGIIIVYQIVSKLFSLIDF